MMARAKKRAAGAKKAERKATAGSHSKSTGDGSIAEDTTGQSLTTTKGKTKWVQRQTTQPNASSEQPTDPLPVVFFHPDSEYGWFSMYYPCKFTDPKIEGVTFTSAEQYFHYRKAVFFDDLVAAREILKMAKPGDAKRWGRKVKGFDESDWNEESTKVATRANILKFNNAGRLGRKLLATNSRELIEANPKDRKWGVGVNKTTAMKQIDSGDREDWGENRLGLVLMNVRTRMQNDADEPLSREESEEEAKDHDINHCNSAIAENTEDNIHDTPD